MHNNFTENESIYQIESGTVSQNFAFRSSHDDFCFEPNAGDVLRFVKTKNDYHTYCTLHYEYNHGMIQVCSRSTLEVHTGSTVGLAAENWTGAVTLNVVVQS